MFQLDDEPIPGINTPANPNSSSRSSPIALAPRASKRKPEAEPIDQPSADIMLLTSGFKEATTILADAYCASQTLEMSTVPAAATEALERRMDQLEVNVQSIADKILNAPPAPLLANEGLEKKVDQIKIDMESMVEKMLQALANLNAAAGLGSLTI